MNDRTKISGVASRILEHPGNTLLVSSASLWELATKASTGRLTLLDNAEAIIKANLQQLGIRVLPVSAGHALGVMRLPPHHRDPFDRLLVAQCSAEKIPLISSDAMMTKYDIEVIW